MTEFLGYTREGLFQEAVEKGRQAGVFSMDAFNEMVEEIIESHRELGEIGDNDPTEGLEDWTEEFWPRYQSELGLDTDISEVIV